MQFLRNTILGLVVLCAFVCSIPVGEDAPVPAPEIKNGSVPENNSTEVKDELASTTLSPTRAQDPSTSVPPLEHAASEAPASPEVAAPAVPAVPAAPGKPEPVITEQKSNEKADTKPDPGKGSATSQTPVYSLALVSVTVLLFSAI